jgi:hypothetical protein
MGWTFAALRAPLGRGAEVVAALGAEAPFCPDAASPPCACLTQWEHGGDRAQEPIRHADLEDVATVAQGLTRCLVTMP